MTLQTLLLLCFIAGLLGMMLFFAFAAAPTVFRSLPPEQAGLYLRAIFPRYYLWALIIAAIISALAYQANTSVFGIGLFITAAFLFSRQLLVPAINKARDAKLAGDEAARRKFGKLHAVSVVINLAQMVLLVIAATIIINSQ